MRAIAVLSVLAFHYGASLPGGFTGLDVFFVISGFLVTQTLAAEIAAGTFSVLGFYDRRMRRILPTLLTMALVLLAGRFLLMPGDYATQATSTAGAAFGVSNFYFLNLTGYFDRAADVQPLLHTWPLAIEEQFYVVWLLLLLGLTKIGARLALAAILAIVVAIGCATSIAYFGIEPKSAFYMALPRAWEHGLGVLLAFLPALPRLIGELTAVAGLALVATGFHLAEQPCRNDTCDVTMNGAFLWFVTGHCWMGEGSAPSSISTADSCLDTTRPDLSRNRCAALPAARSPSAAR
ncbi:peptidoglycan/LPS O-acetylase OafA/YrhL [Bradyrhizobium japonicum USDA 38]|nr:acyltransferase [Bradyrhizobium japonicum]MCS3894588.1 peptidoglycan/LPS O-acetylase OafA/YrhL [Bradyrhizobium japonicum USDA 38]MCS3947102.1 peptidoglycan/LPS O-acetylase OafA/YrhL [Bradyrhizobium japonicum]MCW2220067.1 peptidoglycan/LPS O-acetylase OafA/YrhL [Bradyrhizobium japonicum]MCW2344681.1 peptidoglycan/LPS O-acetylase OafA/YrhL [Bradyrhizobium japonicum]